MIQLLVTSERSRSACIRGSATITMVPSSVDISCMPVIATIATPSTDDDSGVVARSDPEEPPTADMACQPTETRIRRADRRYGYVRAGLWKLTLARCRAKAL